MQRLRSILEEDLFENPKDEDTLMKIIEATTLPGDTILDSFAGSGTTGHSILKLNKLNSEYSNRKFLLIELEDKISKKVTVQRLSKVIGGYKIVKTNGEIEIIEGLGGGFKYCVLDKPLFDEFGNIRFDVTFSDLAHHIFFTETGVPLAAKFKKKKKSAQIGIYKEAAFYLLFNGIMGDKSVNGGNVLTTKILEKLPPYKGKKIIYGEGCRLSPSRLKRENIIFKQLPYEVKVS